MKRTFFLTLVAVLAASTLFAQDWTVGGRWGSYAATVEVGPTSVTADRADSTGGFVAFSHRGFVFRGQFDSESKSDSSPGGAPEANASFERDRKQLLAGWSALQFMDLEAGWRSDSIDMNGFSALRGVGAAKTRIDLDVAAIGVDFHTSQPGRIEWYGSLLGYFGSADVRETGILSESVNATGYHFETGFPIPLGKSGFYVTPGAEFERIDTDDIDPSSGAMTLTSNRFFVSISFRQRK